LQPLGWRRRQGRAGEATQTLGGGSVRLRQRQPDRFV
jgi:hypothetical protein